MVGQALFEAEGVRGGGGGGGSGTGSRAEVDIRWLTLDLGHLDPGYTYHGVRLVMSSLGIDVSAVHDIVVKKELISVCVEVLFSTEFAISEAQSHPVNGLLERHRVDYCPRLELLGELTHDMCTSD